MRELVADRFVPIGETWTDVACGAPVRLRFLPAASRVDEIVWNDQCAERTRLRHPLLNVLVDYGVADPQRRFEAYGVSGPIRASGRMAAHLLRHAARFLESHGLPLVPQASRVALRDVCGALGRRRPDLGRPLGLVLQPRGVLDGLAETLDVVDRSTGPLGIEIAGANGSGIRTTRLLAARLARIAGLVPIASAAIVRLPWLREQLIGRHLCVLLDDHTQEERSSLATFLAELGARSARRHLLLRFTRTDSPPPGARHIDSMGIAAMTSMVFVDGDNGPSHEELFDAARGAGGRPGVFLARLRAHVGEPMARVALVHESSPAYVVGSPDATTVKGVGRVLRDAPERAARLAARGRHASAERLLIRAGRVLASRGEPSLAAACAEQQGWLARERGHGDRALEAFQRARQLAGGLAPTTADVYAVGATIGVGVVRTDQLRLPEAEASLRGACAAADVLRHTGLKRRAALALARCLFWQSRHDEAAITLTSLTTPGIDDDVSVEAWALLARTRAAMGELRAALGAAGEAVGRAGRPVGTRAAFSAFRSMAIVQRLVGDEEQIKHWSELTLRTAIVGHLPLSAIRARCLFVACCAGTDRPRMRRWLAHLRTALARRPLPALLRREVERACASADVPSQATCRSVSDTAIEELEGLLEISQSAPDERRALEHLCEHALERLRAASVQIVGGPPSFPVLARAGRPWQVDAVFVTRVMTCGSRDAASGFSSGSIDRDVEPRLAGEPIRGRREAVAVICSRWAMGTEIDSNRAAGLLRAAALAAAPAVRIVLERPELPVPDPVCADLLGSSEAAAALRVAIARAARAPFPVLVEGESGSGKELVARGIHRLGPRRDRRLCTVNCAALTDDLLEAELFGHARGAFTGAIGERAGLFEEADGGTIFLDEVGELSPRAQAKLLRVLQDGEVRRVGENMPRRVDVRIVAATNRRLAEEVAAGRFRADLRFRLDVIRIGVPALRERSSDVPALAAHFWTDAAGRIGTAAVLAPETLLALARYDWPGNIRELQNVMASLAVHAPRRGRIAPGVLPAHIARTAFTAATTFEAARDEFERRFVRAALAQAGGRRTHAARTLGVSRQGLAKMMRRLRIDDKTNGA